MRKFGNSGFGGGFRPGGFPGGFGGFESSQGNGVRFSFEDIGGLGSLGDIFSSLFGDQVDFGRRRRSRPSTGPRKGSSLAAKLEITFGQMVKGTSKTIKLKRETNCDKCGGTGMEPGVGKTVCPQCQGRGMVAQSVGAFSVSRPCPRCLGRGEIVSEPCAECGGKGRQQVSQNISIKIPAGIEHGAKLRLMNLGQPGVNGGPNGDFIVTIHVQPDKFFQRVGNDVVCKVPISLEQAVDGAKFKVQTLSGSVVLNIPPLTADNTKFKLNGLGIVGKSKRGNQYVTVRVEIPDDPSDEEKELLNKLMSEKNVNA
jgi:molecular chaperone DnaJ